MRKALSFAGEHTVALSIVPILKNLLRKEFENVTPIFPWMNREGGTISKIIHKNDRFRILSLYPRRPKVSSIGEGGINLKINEQIILGAQSGKELGIPIIAGLPLAKDFWQLGNEPKTIFIRLDNKQVRDYEFNIQVGDNGKMESELGQMIFQNDSEILEYILEATISLGIDEAISAFKRIKMATLQKDFYTRFLFTGGYKPIYFLLK